MVYVGDMPARDFMTVAAQFYLTGCKMIVIIIQVGKWLNVHQVALRHHPPGLGADMASAQINMLQNHGKSLPTFTSGHRMATSMVHLRMSTDRMMAIWEKPVDTMRSACACSW